MSAAQEGRNAPSDIDLDAKMCHIQPAGGHMNFTSMLVIAVLIVIIVSINVIVRRRRAQMTPRERAEEDREMQIW